MSIALCCFIHLVGIIVFLGGFFPLKPAIHDTASASDICFSLKDECCGDNNTASLPTSGCVLQPLYSRLVLIIIDALRTDFVLPEVNRDGQYTSCSEPRMSGVCRLIVGQQTASFHAVAHPPTVTMPRIKVRQLSNQHHYHHSHHAPFRKFYFNTFFSQLCHSAECRCVPTASRFGIQAR